MKAKCLNVAGVFVFLAIFFFAGLASASDKKFAIGVTKGAYAIENGLYKEAQTNLKKALDINGSDPQALLLMGIALSRDREYSKAKGYLVDALKQDPDLWRAKFELGVVHYHLGNWNKAGNLFEEVGKSDADKYAKSVAQKYLSRMSAGEDPGNKAYSLNLYAGWQYDDNVILESENSSLFMGDESDWRWLAIFDGTVALFQNSFSRVEAGYEYYHSFHDTLDEFDIEQHSLSLAGAFDPEGPFKAELEYEYTDSKLDDKDYSNFHVIRPILSLKHTPVFQTELHYAHEIQDFEDFDLTFASRVNSFRTGKNDAFGVKEKITINQHFLLSLDYTYNEKDVDEGTVTDGAWTVVAIDQWKYNGHKGTVKLTSKFDKWQLFFAGSYFEKDYDGSPWTKYDSAFGSLISSTHRKDETQEYSFAIVWNPLKWLSISLTENYVINDSNLEGADYKRNVIGLLVGVSR